MRKGGAGMEISPPSSGKQIFRAKFLDFFQIFVNLVIIYSNSIKMFYFFKKTIIKDTYGKVLKSMGHVLTRKG